MTFAGMGLRAFDVFYRDGTVWKPIPGASVRNNSLVWREFTFDPITTTQILVLVPSNLNDWTHVAEVEAWGWANNAPSPAPEALVASAGSVSGERLAAVAAASSVDPASSSIREATVEMPDGSQPTPVAEAPPTANPPVITYYHTDILGSVRALTDAAGALVAGSRIDYFAFGETSAPMTGDPRKYIGGEVDAETAFEYLGARYYRNVWGRFTSPDPVMSGAALTNPQLWNRYTYGLNSPLRFRDPSGMEAERFIVADYGGANLEFHQGENFEAWAMNLYMTNLVLAVQAGIIDQQTLFNQMPLGTADMMRKAIELSNEKIEVTDAKGKKKTLPGGFREAGFTGDLITGVFSNIVTGLYTNPPADTTTPLESQSSWTSVFAVHVHPAGTIQTAISTDLLNGRTIVNTTTFRQKPGQGDFDAARAANYQFGVVIAAGENNKLYFYNAGGQIGDGMAWPYPKIKK